MRIVFLSHVYWPDDVSTAQHLVDLCELLASQGEEVEVVTSRRKYEDRRVKFSRKEFHNSVKITRLDDLAFGKRTLTGRFMDSLSFNILLFIHILLCKKPEIFLGTTSPPLVSFFGLLAARIRGTRFCYWAMDLQPELSIRSGLLKSQSISARTLSFIGDYTYKHADKIVVLDKYMRDHVVRHGANAQRVSIAPVWPVTERRFTGLHLENPFRITHGFGEAIVVMYSGNHSFVHPFDTLLKAALHFKDDPTIRFVFIGAGVRVKDVSLFKAKNRLDSIVQLPYQPREEIHISLSAADVQVVVMGDNLVGLTHPNKIYGAMFAGKPILYLGPSPSHVSDILEKVPGNIICSHGDTVRLAQEIGKLKKMGRHGLQQVGCRNLAYAREHFDPTALKRQMSSEVLSSGKSREI